MGKILKIVKSGVLSLLLVSMEVYSAVDFSLQNFTRYNQGADVRIQRSIIRATDSKKIDSKFYAQLDGDLVFSTLNSNQYVARDEEESFYLNLRKFNLGYKVSSLTLYLGVQESYSTTLSSVLSAPGAGVVYAKDSVKVSSGLLNIPSSRKYIVHSGSSSNHSQLWTSNLEVDFEFINFWKFKFTANYDYYNHLGSDVAFQSGLRGNSTVGNQLNAEFLFDYSIVSTKMILYNEFKNILFSPYLEYGENLGAYKSENKFYRIGSIFNRGRWLLDLSYESIAKNALIAVYTPNRLDNTALSGPHVELNYDFKNNLALNMMFANYLHHEDATQQFSSLIGLVLRN